MCRSMLYFLLCLVAVQRCTSLKEHCISKLEVFETLFHDYTKTRSPRDFVNVTVDLSLENIIGYNEANDQLQIDLMVQERWLDERLDHKNFKKLPISCMVYCILKVFCAI